MRFKKIILIIGILLFNTTIKALNNQEQIILPTIPDSLTNPKDRADYLITHYWDNFNFMDTIYESLPIEQAFVDYIYILPHASDITKARNSLTELMLNTNKKKTGKTSLYFLSLFEKYLYEITSPVQNDEYYIPVIEQALTFENLSEIDKIKYKVQLHNIKKNRVEETASDFTFYNQNKEQKISEIEYPYLLLMFYNPDCHDCIQMIEQFQKSEIINQLLKNEILKILTLSVNNVIDFPENEKQSWIYANVNYPEILDLYFIRSFPDLYLLNREQNVVLKNVDFEKLELFLENME